MLLKGKKVLITGGERGIGRQTALSAAQEGADILVVGVLEEEMAVTVRMVQELGVNAYSAKMDITDYEATDRTIKDLAVQSGGIDVLVNNAGIFQEAFFVDMTPAQWRKTISVDLDGVYNVTHAAIPYIIEKKGSVISIASQDAFYGCPGYSHYAACKAALVGLTRTLARELGSTGVRFNCVAPGIIQTDMTKDRIERDLDSYLAKLPVGRVGRPEDIANAIIFLASEKASNITGQVIHCNGGMYLG